VSLTAPPASHRERKKLATRQAIHDAAFDLVDRHGLSGTTIEAISDRAGVAPRTFWSYFGSKEEAVVNRDPDVPPTLADALLARPADEDALTALQTVLEEFSADRAVDSRRAVRRGQLIRREPQLMAAVAASFEEIERALIAAVAERLGLDPASDLTPGVLVVAACGTCRVAQQHWADEGGQRPFQEVLREAYRSLDAGLGRSR
jgi:AcrR family transcriptional regulator